MLGVKEEGKVRGEDGQDWVGVGQAAAIVRVRAWGGGE